MSRPDVKAHDRIRLEQMNNDPCPIPAGATGTVRRVTQFFYYKAPDHFQISVAWDNHRSLMLVPGDEFKVIERPRAAYFQEAVDGLDR